MRVLHIGNELSWRGGENQVRLLVEGLNARGVTSTIAYPIASRGYERFSDLTETIGLPSRSAYDPRSVLRLIRYCRQHKIELLDAHSSGGMSLALAVKSRLPNLKLVVHRRVDNAIKKNWLTRRKYLNPKVDRFVCISNAIAEILRAYGVSEHKISVVRSAVDDSPYHDFSKAVEKSRLLEGESGAGVVIGNASALTHQKGYSTLLAACARLNTEGLNFRCYIAGDGPAQDNLRQQARDLGLGGTVFFLGHLQNVHRFLSALDILAVPSNNEGLGTILLEGAFAGCTLVGTRVGGIPEIIRHEVTGLMVEAGDAVALARELKRVILDQDLRARLARQGEAYVREQFSLKAMVEGNWRVYQQLLGAEATKQTASDGI